MAVKTKIGAKIFKNLVKHIIDNPNRFEILLLTINKISRFKTKDSTLGYDGDHGGNGNHLAGYRPWWNVKKMPCETAMVGSWQIFDNTVPT